LNADTIDANKINKPLLYLTAGVTTGALVAGHFINANNYWGNNGPFHVMNSEYEYYDALLSDKFGHLYFSYGLTKLLRHVYELPGFDSTTAVLISGGITLLTQTYVEIQDGFSYGGTYLGFSWGDFYANIFGTGIAILQVYEPYFRNFLFKVSIYQHREMWRPPNYSLIEDYESRYNWLSINIHNLLPDSWRKYYPSFLNLALGFSVKDINRYGSGFHEIFIALDWNTDLIPEKSGFLRFLRDAVSLYKLPAPAVKIYPDVVWYGLKF
jgi:hypothetical protein